MRVVVPFSFMGIELSDNELVEFDAPRPWKSQILISDIEPVANRREDSQSAMDDILWLLSRTNSTSNVDYNHIFSGWHMAFNNRKYLLNQDIND